MMKRILPVALVLLTSVGCGLELEQNSYQIYRTEFLKYWDEVPPNEQASICFTVQYYGVDTMVAVWAEDTGISKDDPEYAWSRSLINEVCP